MIKMDALIRVPPAKRFVKSATKPAQPIIHTIEIATRRFGLRREARFSDLIADYDVVIMKHCYPASDVLEDIGKADLSSLRQSLENYRAIYALLRNKFDKIFQNPF